MIWCKNITKLCYFLHLSIIGRWFKGFHSKIHSWFVLCWENMEKRYNLGTLEADNNIFMFLGYEYISFANSVGILVIFKL